MKGQGLKVSLIAVWVAATAIFALWLTSDRISALEQKLESDGQILHRLISQRADQHDAHLTGLSALASSNKQPPLDILLNLAETIRRFYPRITSVDLIALRTMKPEVVFSTRQNDVGADLALSIRKAALASTGALQIIPTDSGYLLVKRSPNSDASRFGLALNIDARKLVESDRELSPGTTLKLETQDRRKVFQNEASTEQPPSTGFLQPLGFEKTLGSRSQPLVLSLESRASLAEVSGPDAAETSAARILVGRPGPLPTSIYFPQADHRI